MPRNKFEASLLRGALLLMGVSLFTQTVFADQAVSSSVPLGGEATSSSEAPFHPFWNGEISAAYFAEDGGQKGSLFFLTGWDRLTPQGSFFEAKVFGGTQQIEKIQTASGGIEMGGGVGLGDLTPSLLVNLEHGGSDFNAIRVLIGLDKKISSVLQLNLFLTGEVTSHQGPLGAYVGLPAGSTAEVDNLNAWGGGSLKWTLLSPLDLTFTFKTESDETVKIQDPAHVSFNEVDTTESMDTIVLQAGLALDPHWRLSAEGQGGLEASPAGTFYSKRLAQTITQSTSQNVTFAGFSLGLDYHF